MGKQERVVKKTISFNAIMQELWNPSIVGGPDTPLEEPETSPRTVLAYTHIPRKILAIWRSDGLYIYRYYGKNQWRRLIPGDSPEVTVEISLLMLNIKICKDGKHVAISGHLDNQKSFLEVYRLGDDNSILKLKVDSPLPNRDRYGERMIFINEGKSLIVTCPGSEHTQPFYYYSIGSDVHSMNVNIGHCNVEGMGEIMWSSGESSFTLGSVSSNILHNYRLTAVDGLKMNEFMIHSDSKPISNAIAGPETNSWYIATVNKSVPSTTVTVSLYLVTQSKGANLIVTVKLKDVAYTPFQRQCCLELIGVKSICITINSVVQGEEIKYTFNHDDY